MPGRIEFQRSGPHRPRSRRGPAPRGLDSVAGFGVAFAGAQVTQHFSDEVARVEGLADAGRRATAFSVNATSLVESRGQHQDRYALRNLLESETPCRRLDEGVEIQQNAVRKYLSREAAAIVDGCSQNGKDAGVPQVHRQQLSNGCVSNDDQDGLAKSACRRVWGGRGDHMFSGSFV